MARHRWSKTEGAPMDIAHCMKCGCYRQHVPDQNRWRTVYRLGAQEVIVATKGDKAPPCTERFFKGADHGTT